MADSGVRVWWLYGAPCVGESAAAWELYAHQMDGEPRGYFDIDQLGICYPQPYDHAETTSVKTRAAGVLVRHLADSGVRTVVISGVLEPGSHDRVAQALGGAAVTFCRLRADPEVLRPRLRARYGPEDVQRALAEADSWDEQDTGRPVVDSGRGLSEVAREVLTALQDATPAPPSPAPEFETAQEPPSLEAPSRGVLVCGTTGVGKSTLAFGLAMQAWSTGRTCAFLDLQQLGFSRDVPLVDAGRCQVGAAVVADLWQVYPAAGAVDLVLTGRVESGEDVDRYRQALGATPLLVVRLRADSDQLCLRITARSRGEGGPELAGDALRGTSAAAVDGVLHEALTLQERLDRAEVADVVLQTDRADAQALTEHLGRLREQHLPAS